MWLRQSTSAVITFGPFVDETNGVTPQSDMVTDLDNATTGIMLSKNGATLAVRNATVTATTYDAHGCYRVTLNTTDTSTKGILRVIYSNAATCLPVWKDFMVIPQQQYDAIVDNSGYGMRSAVYNMDSGTITALAIATDAIGANELASTAIDEIVAGVWAKVCETEGSYTAQQILSIALAVLAGETNTAGSIFRTPNDAATRVTATLDASNNRTAMTLAPSA